MRKLSLVLFVMFLSVSAFAGNHEKLIGSWAFDAEKFKASEEYKEAIKDPQAGQMMQMVLGMMSKLSFTFTKTDATAHMPGMDGKVKDDKAAYTVVEDKGNTLEIKTEGKEGEAQNMIITFIDAKTIKMGPKVPEKGPMQIIYLKKK